jgi:predicted lipoprotein with Yx(FWY)xxD motif
MNGHKFALNALVAGVLAVPLITLSHADAATMLTAANGMTLYTYDRDAGGKPTCNALCAVAWPPYLANGEKKGEGWTTVQRANGALQWAYDGKPVYFYTGDGKKGDANGNGAEGIWHVVSE